CLALADIRVGTEIPGPPASVRSGLALDEEGDVIAWPDARGDITVTRLSDGSPVARLLGDGSPVCGWCIAFSPGGRFLAAAHAPGGPARLGSVPAPRRPLHEARGAELLRSNVLYGAAFSPDGRRYAVGGDRALRVFDLPAFRERGALDAPPRRWDLGADLFT